MCYTYKKTATKTVRLPEMQRVSVWCELTVGRHKTYHFRAGRPNGDLVGFPVCPR